MRCHYCRGSVWWLNEVANRAHLAVIVSQSRADRAEASRELDRIHTRQALLEAVRARRPGNHFHVLAVHAE